MKELVLLEVTTELVVVEWWEFVGFSSVTEESKLLLCCQPGVNDTELV